MRLFGFTYRRHGTWRDIDLYIEAEADERTRLQQSRELRFALLTRLGDQRIDIVTAPPGGKDPSIDTVVQREGIELTNCST